MVCTQFYSVGRRFWFHNALEHAYITDNDINITDANYWMCLKIDRWNSFTKASYAISFLEIQASYPLNTINMATSGQKLKGTQKSPHCVYIRQQEALHKELKMVKTYSCN